MPEKNPSPKSTLLQLTAQIVSAHVARNEIAADRLSDLIHTIYKVMRDLDGAEPVNPHRPQPAVLPKHSIFPDYIICLEDGRKLKMLKRHLKTKYNLTPDAYRQKWELSPDYPMVAPNYMRHRSSLAKSSGLGRAANSGKSRK